MKIMSYFQLALSILIFVCVVVQIIRHIVIGGFNGLGVIFATVMFVLTLSMVFFAWAEVKGCDNDDKKMLRR